MQTFQEYEYWRYMDLTVDTFSTDPSQLAGSRCVSTILNVFTLQIFLCLSRLDLAVREALEQYHGDDEEPYVEFSFLSSIGSLSPNADHSPASKLRRE